LTGIYLRLAKSFNPERKKEEGRRKKEEGRGKKEKVF
jgi:hypothetical protein